MRRPRVPLLQNVRSALISAGLGTPQARIAASLGDTDPMIGKSHGVGARNLLAVEVQVPSNLKGSCDPGGDVVVAATAQWGNSLPLILALPRAIISEPPT